MNLTPYQRKVLVHICLGGSHKNGPFSQRNSEKHLAKARVANNCKTTAQLAFEFGKQLEVSKRQHTYTPSVWRYMRKTQTKLSNRGSGGNTDSLSARMNGNRARLILIGR